MKRLLALFLAVTLVFSFAGCTGNDTDDQSTVTEPAVQTETPSEGNTDSGEESEPEAGSNLPLCEELETLSVFQVWPGFFSMYTEGPDNDVWEEIQRLTNVALDFQPITAETASETFNIMATSGTLPDMIQEAAMFLSIGGTKGGVETGVLMDLTALVDEFMPNYKAFIESDELYEEMLVDTGGTISAVYQVYSPATTTDAGPVVRKDYFDATGITEIPSTYDEWYEMMTALKVEAGVKWPLTISYNYADQGHTLAKGYGVTMSFDENMFMLDGDTVIFGAYDSRNGDYLSTMSTWYKEGLLDNEFITRVDYGNDPDQGLISAGETAIFITGVFAIETYEALFEDPVTFIPIYAPSETEDRSGMLQNSAVVRNTDWTLSSTCSNPELCAKWMDFFYTEEGIMLANWGVQGVTYKYDENGEPTFTELMINNDISLPMNFIVKILSAGNAPSVLDWKRLYVGVSEERLEALDIWVNAGNSTRYEYPTVAQMTADESQELADIMSDIYTYIEETTLSIITGALPASYFSTMTDTMKDMGIEDAIAIKQAAYDRYKAG